HRLLKQARLRVAGRHRALENVQLMCVHPDPGECAGPVGIVGQLDEMSFNHVLPVPGHVVQLRVALKELERRVDDRPALVMMRVSGTYRGWSVGAAVRVAGRTGFGALDALLLDAAVIDHSQRVALTTLL